MYRMAKTNPLQLFDDRINSFFPHLFVSVPSHCFYRLDHVEQGFGVVQLPVQKGMRNQVYEM